MWCSGAPCWPLGACVTLGGRGCSGPGLLLGPTETPQSMTCTHTETHIPHLQASMCTQSHVCLDVQICAPAFKQRGNTMRVLLPTRLRISIDRFTHAGAQAREHGPLRSPALPATT